MSDHIVRLIPTHPSFVPAAEERVRAEALMKAHFNAPEITFKVSDRVQLVDCGQNLEHVRCPKCGAEMEIGAWQDAMNAAYDGEGFGDLSLRTECCGHATTLNDLDYSFPMGFARAVLELRDPGSDLPRGLLVELETILGCRLRILYAHI